MQVNSFAAGVSSLFPQALALIRGVVMRTQAGSVAVWASLPAIALVTAVSAFSGPANAQRQDRQGKEVVDAVCIACHASGKDGAPRIGDTAAWADRSARGLTSLTESAIKGIRRMPAHGGSAGVSDAEIGRAIVYMVNHSGGNWVEPIDRGAPLAARTSEAIVQTQCAQCHQTGKQGAPKIGDRTAWTPRLGRGLDVLVASAVHGHGPMPSRGGMPDLSREEIRHAILYMFNYGLPPVSPPPVAAVDPHHKLVSGTDIYFGIMPADAIRAAQAQAQKTGAPKVDVPAGKGYYHLNISLADNASRAPVTDAQVIMQVSDGMRTETKTLGPVAANNAVSYGNYFRFSSGSSYNIKTEIKRPGLASPIVANFDFKAP
jgi:cytochrome c5